jgi:F-box/leucine-rich repeat protein 2/20
MLQIMKHCPKLRSAEMDNTRVSDLTLMEASFRVRKRGYGEDMPKVGLRLVVFDCANVTWAGIKEVLSSNAYIPRTRKSSTNPIVSVTQTSLDSDSATSTAFVTPSSTPSPSPTFPAEIIQLKCFYGWQMTVDEHTKRVLRGDLNAASRLDRKWADYMMATEEAGAAGAGARRRRRRARCGWSLCAWRSTSSCSKWRMHCDVRGSLREPLRLLSSWILLFFVILSFFIVFWEHEHPSALDR